MESHRLFIALPLPAEVKDAIEATQRELRDALLQGRVNWTKREQFHLTLKFLGNVLEFCWKCDWFFALLGLVFS